MSCCSAISGEGLYQVLETVESGLLADDDDGNIGDVSEQTPATSDPGLCNSSSILKKVAHTRLPSIGFRS